MWDLAKSATYRPGPRVSATRSWMVERVTRHNVKKKFPICYDLCTLFLHLIYIIRDCSSFSEAFISASINLLTWEGRPPD